jgi:hypothetical protein
VAVRYQVCDDKVGQLGVELREKRVATGQRPVTYWHDQTVEQPHIVCASYRLRWQRRSRFILRSRYSLTLRVRDAEAAVSEPATKTLIISSL